MNVSDLPTVNAVLNCISTILLATGFIFIKKGKRESHKKIMLTALVSVLTERKVKDTVAMTGEITLQGKVLPIGGVKQKVLAAHRAGLTEVIVPRRNEIDIDDVPEKVREDIIFHIADTVDDVLKTALN